MKTYDTKMRFRFIFSSVFSFFFFSFLPSLRFLSSLASRCFFFLSFFLSFFFFFFERARFGNFLLSRKVFFVETGRRDRSVNFHGYQQPLVTSCHQVFEIISGTKNESRLAFHNNKIPRYNARVN